jgi:hypothetical protein
MNPVIYEQIMSLLGLIGLWAFWYYLWKPQRVDAFRQELFGLRSELFDLGANQVVPFDHAAYAQLRLMINGTIRYAHQVSFPTLLVVIAQSEHAPSDPLAVWKKHVQELPEDGRNRLLAIHNRVSGAFAKHLIGGSIILFSYVLLRVLYAGAKALTLLLIGKKDFRRFTVTQARYRVENERKNVARAGVDVIEARVLQDEQRRTGAKREPAYAH